MREKERVALAAERADLEFLCKQDYLNKLKRQRHSAKHKKNKSGSACSSCCVALAILIAAPALARLASIVDIAVLLQATA
eukprot:4678386-Pleurochrysis_carterae.AAC.1